MTPWAWIEDGAREVVQTREHAEPRERGEARGEKLVEMDARRRAGPQRIRVDLEAEKHRAVDAGGAKQPVDLVGHLEEVDEILHLAAEHEEQGLAGTEDILDDLVEPARRDAGGDARLLGEQGLDRHRRVGDAKREVELATAEPGDVRLDQTSKHEWNPAEVALALHFVPVARDDRGAGRAEPEEMVAMVHGGGKRRCQIIDIGLGQRDAGLVRVGAGPPFEKEGRGDVGVVADRSSRPRSTRRRHPCPARRR